MKTPDSPASLMSGFRGQKTISIQGINYIKMIKIKYNVFWFLMISLATGSCLTEEQVSCFQTINIETGLKNLNRINLSQYAVDVEYIPLSEIDGNFLKQIRVLDYRDSVVLVSDLNSCCVFSFNGFYLKKIGEKGRGPAEYPTISNVRLGSKGRIYIQSLRDLYVYSKEGDFIERLGLFKSDAFSSGGPGNWLFVSDTTIFVQIRNDSGSANSKAVEIDLSGKILRSYVNYLKFKNDRKGSSSLSSVSSIYEFNGTLRYKELFNDTLFMYNSTAELLPVFVLSLGSLSASYMDFYEQTMGRARINREWARVNEIFETDDLILIDLQSNLEYLKRPEPYFEDGINQLFYAYQILGVFDKMKRELAFSEITRTDEKLLRTGLYNDIDGGPKFYPMFRMGSNRLVMSIEAFHLIEYIRSDSFKNSKALYPEKKIALKELANSLSEDDNPVLMVVTMK